MRALLLLAVLATVAVGCIFALSAGDDANATRSPEAAALASACPDTDFDRYDAGPAIDGHRKSEAVRRCEPDAGAPTRINMVVTFYGSCEPSGSDGGCAPPVQVQSWPSCEHNLALYQKYPAPDGTTEQYTRTRIRGVPAAIFEGGQRIEIYTAKTTLVIFAKNAGLATAAANRLVGVHAGRVVDQTDELPPPVEGAMEDKLAC